MLSSVKLTLEIWSDFLAARPVLCDLIPAPFFDLISSSFPYTNSSNCRDDNIDHDNCLQW